MTLRHQLKQIRLSKGSRTAIVKDGQTISFAQLSRYIEICQCNLPSSPTPVLIQVQCRLKAIILMLAAIERGYPFVPIDQDKSAASVADIIGNFPKILIINDLILETGEIVYIWHGEEQTSSTIPSDVMSVMFTSGSTGKPKGVLVPSAAVENLLSSPSFMSLDEDEVFATYSSLSFDASTFEIFTPLLNGKVLIILDKEDVIDDKILSKKIAQHQITALWMTAGLFNQRVSAGHCNALKTLRKLIVGGDKVETEAARTFLKDAHNTKLFNGYGPTENTVFTTVAEIMHHAISEDKGLPIGKLIPGVVHCLISPDSAIPVFQGSGRLLVKGKGLSPGYLNNPLETTRAFVTLSSGERWYDTGDYVECDAERTFYFIGRNDRQVKLNGHRVELSDIEYRLLREPVFKKVLAVLISGELVLIFTPLQETTGVDWVKNLARNCLNNYEMPRHFLMCSNWPLTENGKFDVKALTHWVENEIARLAPKSMSDDVKGIAESILNTIIFDKNRGLFDLGFNSISITRLQAEINRTFNVYISMLDIYSVGNIIGLEKLVQIQSECS